MTREELKQIADTVRSCIVETDKNSHTNAVLSGVANGIEKMDVEPCEDGAWSLKDAADALKRHGLLQEQEPCEDTISFPKGTLKKRGKGYVVYDVEWFKKNWRTELKVMGVECEDCISRAELLKAIDTWDRFGVDDTNSLFRLDNLSLPHYVPYIHFDDVVKCIKGMPSVTPKQKMGRWIPVSERLPGEEGYYLVTTDETYNDAIDIAHYTKGSWHKASRIKAWMPLPEPYMSENPTSSNCTACILDGTDACSRGAGRAVDGRVCEDFVGESED